MNQPVLSVVQNTKRVATVGVPEVSIIIPTYCERENVPIMIERIESVLANTAWEIIFVDDDSPDGTANLIKSIAAGDPRIRCIRRVKRCGLAGASIEGMLASQAEYVALIDGDLQHDETLLAQMLARLKAGDADIVIGSRYGFGSAIEMSGVRRWSSHFATELAMRVLGISVSDPLSGFFMARRALIEDIAPLLSTQGFKILMDILTCSDTKARVLELPYNFRARQHGASKLDGKVVLDFAGLLLSRATHDLIPTQFFLFLLVGSIGILVHLAALKVLLSYSDMTFIGAQTGATAVAMTGNFFLNNELTYRDQRLAGRRALLGLLIFFAVCSVGAVSNIGVANWLYSNEPNWWLAGLLGSAVSAVWNYAVSSALVWHALGR